MSKSVPLVNDRVLFAKPAVHLVLQQQHVLLSVWIVIVSRIVFGAEGTGLGTGFIT